MIVWVGCGFGPGRNKRVGWVYGFGLVINEGPFGLATK